MQPPCRGGCSLQLGQNAPPYQGGRVPRPRFAANGLDRTSAPCARLAMRLRGRSRTLHFASSRASTNYKVNVSSSHAMRALVRRPLRGRPITQRANLLDDKSRPSADKISASVQEPSARSRRQDRPIARLEDLFQQKTRCSRLGGPGSPC